MRSKSPNSVKLTLFGLFAAAILVPMASSYSVLQTMDFTGTGNTDCSTNTGGVVVLNTTLPTCVSNGNGTFSKQDCSGDEVTSTFCNDEMCSENCTNSSSPIKVDQCNNGVMYKCFAGQDSGRFVKHEQWDDVDNCTGNISTSEIIVLPSCETDQNAGDGTAFKGDCVNGFYMTWSCTDSSCSSCIQTAIQTSVSANGTCDNTTDAASSEKWTCATDNRNNGGNNTSPTGSRTPNIMSPVASTSGIHPPVTTSPQPSTSQTPVSQSSSPVPNSPAPMPPDEIRSDGSRREIAAVSGVAALLLAIMRA